MGIILSLLWKIPDSNDWLIRIDSKTEICGLSISSNFMGILLGTEDSLSFKEELIAETSVGEVDD